MKSFFRATARGAKFAAPTIAPEPANSDAPFYHDLVNDARSIHEVPGGATTLVVVDMQRVFLTGWNNESKPPIDAVIRQVEEAMANNWSIVLLEMRPWRLGESVMPLANLLHDYPRVYRRSKQTPSGGKEVLSVCREKGLGMGLFRVVGVFLDACVLETVEDIFKLEPTALVRMIEEGCSTDIDVPGAWSFVQERLAGQDRLAISSEQIDGDAAELSVAC